MKKYWVYLKGELSLMTTYRLDLFGRWIMNFFEVVIYVALWSLTSKTQGDTYKLIAYFSLYWGLLNNIHTSKTASWIGEAINSGDLSNYLIRPVSFPLLQVIRSLVKVLVRVMVPVILIVVGSLVRPEVFAPLSFVNFLVFLLFTLAGLVIWNLLVISISSLAFLGTEISSTLTVLDLAINLLKGAYIPAFLFPAWLSSGLRFTFIPYLASFPIKMYQESLVQVEVLFGLGMVVIWMVGLGLTSVTFYKLGLKRYEASGN